MNIDGIKIRCVSCDMDLNVESIFNNHSGIFICRGCNSQVNVKIVGGKENE